MRKIRMIFWVALCAAVLSACSGKNEKEILIKEEQDSSMEQEEPGILEEAESGEENFGENGSLEGL